jgi:putative hydrolase of the HAD superfamily
MIKAIVFDVDGVLVENKVFASVLEREYGISREMTAPFFHGPFEECVLGRAELREALPEFLVKWKWPQGVDEFIRAWFEADARVNRPVLEFIGRMRAGGRRCYIASTQERQRVAYLEKLPAFAGLFDRCFFSCRLGCQKPERRFFDRIVAETGESAGGFLLLDDNDENVAGARRAGWNAELYRWGMDLGGVTLKYGIIYPSV